jgi:hypothetical protein
VLRPNVATTRDRLDLKALPLTVGMELDYRTQVGDPAADLHHAIRHTIHACLWGLVTVGILRIAGAVTSASLFVAIMTALGLASAIKRLIAAEPLTLVARDVLVGPVIWLLSIAANTSWIAVLIVAVLLAAMQLANRMTYHYARWMHANIYLSRDVRQRWLRVWRPTDCIDYLRAALTGQPDLTPDTDEIVALERSERRRYATGFAVVLAAFLLAVVVHLLCLPAPLAGFASVGVFVIALVAYGLPAALQYDPKVTPRLLFRLLKDAYVSWFTYNAHGTVAPGVFQSPSGFAFARFWRTMIVLFFITLCVLPAARYFPVALPIFGYGAFHDAARSPMPWDDFDWNLFALKSPVPPRSERPVGLTDEQRRYISRLPVDQRERAERAFEAGNRHELVAIASAARLGGRPEAMLWAYVRGAIALDPRMIFAVAMALVACLVAAPLLLAAIWLAIGGRTLVHHFLTLEGTAERRARYHPDVRPHLWEAYVQRLRDSQFVVDVPDRPTVRERDHFFLGVFEEQDYPVLLSPGVLDEHGHVTGDSGAGKSSLGLAPLLEQIIRRGEDSVLIVDLKGDMSLFESVRRAVERLNENRPPGAQIPFKWLTNQNGCSTFAFNPFLQSDMEQVTMHQKVEILIKSLGLEYGEGYGTSYYSASHRFVLERMLEANVRFESLRELNEYFQDASSGVWKDANIRPRTRDDATHLYTTVNSLAQVDALNVTAGHGLPPEVLEQRIDLGALVRAPQVVYFYLHSALEETAVRAITKLALYSLLVAAIRRGPAKHRVYAVVDEFQQVVSEDLQIFLRQARSSKIPVILANQTISDLRTKQADLIPTVLGNTRFRQVFSASDLLQQQILIDSSGEAMYGLFSRGEQYSARGYSESHRTTEQIGPRLRRNDIIQASNEELTSIMHVTRGHGYSQFGGFPFPIRTMYHIPFSEYQRRQSAAWPAAAVHPGTFTPPLARASSSSSPVVASPRPMAPAVQQELSDLAKRIDQLEETIP